MRVKVTDKEYWIKKAEAARQRILERRRVRDQRYERNWRQSQTKWLFWKKEVPETTMPPHDAPIYPCIHGWGTLERLEKLLNALKEVNTEEIFLSEDDIAVMQ